MARTERQGSNLWVNLVGDNRGFEGDTVEDKRILISLIGKTSFTWEEENEVVREANRHDYGVNIIVFDKEDWKENYYRGIRNKNQLRRKAA